MVPRTLLWAAAASALLLCAGELGDAALPAIVAPLAARAPLPAAAATAPARCRCQTAAPCPSTPCCSRGAAAPAHASGSSQVSKCVEGPDTADNPRCKRCSPDAARCLECWAGFGLAPSGECVPCNVTSDHGDRCIRCDGEDTSFCLECQPRFGMGGATGEAVLRHASGCAFRKVLAPLLTPSVAC